MEAEKKGSAYATYNILIILQRADIHTLSLLSFLIQGDKALTPWKPQKYGAYRKDLSCHWICY